VCSDPLPTVASVRDITHTLTACSSVRTLGVGTTGGRIGWPARQHGVQKGPPSFFAEAKESGKAASLPACVHRYLGESVAHERLDLRPPTPPKRVALSVVLLPKGRGVNPKDNHKTQRATSATSERSRTKENHEATRSRCDKQVG